MMYFEYIGKYRKLYNDYRKLRKAVTRINKDILSQLRDVIFSRMLDEKILHCDLRIEELDRGIKKSFFPYPKKYEKLYDRLLKTIGEGDK